MPRPILFRLARRTGQGMRSARQLGSPRLLRGRYPLPYAPPITITGVTYHSTGTPEPGCIVQVFETATDRFVTEVVSDADGLYTVYVGTGTGPYYLVAYLAGSPDTAGTTVNTIVGA